MRFGGTVTHLLNLLALLLAVLFEVPIKVRVHDAAVDEAGELLQRRVFGPALVLRLAVRDRVARTARRAGDKPLAPAGEGDNVDVGFQTKGADELDTESMSVAAFPVSLIASTHPLQPLPTTTTVFPLRSSTDRSRGQSPAWMTLPSKFSLPGSSM